MPAYRCSDLLFPAFLWKKTPCLLAAYWRPHGKVFDDRDDDHCGLLKFKTFTQIRAPHDCNLVEPQEKSIVPRRPEDFFRGTDYGPDSLTVPFCKAKGKTTGSEQALSRPSGSHFGVQYGT